MLQKYSLHVVKRQRQRLECEWTPFFGQRMGLAKLDSRRP